MDWGWFRQDGYKLCVEIPPGVIGSKIDKSLLDDVLSMADGVDVRGTELRTDYLYKFSHLEMLWLRDIRGELDMLSFSKMRVCSFDGQKILNLDKSKSLSVVILWKNFTDDEDCFLFSGLENLKTLRLHRTKTRTLLGLSNLKLKKFDISYQPEGLDISGLANSCESLEFFDVDSVKNIKNLELISRMTAIDWLFLKNIGDIESLSIFEAAIKRGCNVRILDSVVLDGVVKRYRDSGLYIDPFKRSYN